MQQTMDEITDYLAKIDEKVDDVLRAQKDAVLARMIGVGFVIEEAMTIREHGGRVNEVTWSKVQATSATIAETQAYALRQLDALAEKMERKTKIRDLATAAKEAESSVREWLAVLARCFQLTDAIAVLELDRVLAAAPDDLDGHRLGIEGFPAPAVGQHLSEHRAPDGPHRCGYRRGQHEGAVASEKIAGCGAFGQPCLDRHRRIPRASRDRARSAVIGREAMGGSGRGGQGQSARDRSRARRCHKAPR